MDVALVTGDPRAQELAANVQFLVIEDTRNESETAAIEMATAWCEAQGYDTTIVIPGDIPLARAEELHQVLDAAPPEGMVFVPAYDRRGSNCILRRPASIIPLRFGNDSFLPHCEAMQQTGKPLIILEMPGIGLDIDNPHELDCCWRARATPNAQRLLRSWNFSRTQSSKCELRPLPPHEEPRPTKQQRRRTSRHPGARHRRCEDRRFAGRNRSGCCYRRQPPIQRTATFWC